MMGSRVTRLSHFNPRYARYAFKTCIPTLNRLEVWSVTRLSQLSASNLKTG
jgi:hypothetical protein